MKLYFVLASLIATSSVLSYSIERRDKMEDTMHNIGAAAGAASNATNVDFEIIVADFETAVLASNNLSTQCQKVIEEYNSCLPNVFVENNHDNNCDLYNSEKCVKILENKIIGNSECKDIGEKVQGLMDLSIGMRDLYCAKNGDEYCPFSKLLIKKKLDLSDPTYDAAIEETCKYQKCREKAINAFTSIKSYNEKVYEGKNKKNDGKVNIDNNKIADGKEYDDNDKTNDGKVNEDKNKTNDGNVNENKNNNIDEKEYDEQSKYLDDKEYKNKKKRTLEKAKRGDNDIQLIEEKYLKRLNDEKCAVQVTNQANNQSTNQSTDQSSNQAISSANSLKIGSTFLLTLTIFLYFF